MSERCASCGMPMDSCECLDLLPPSPPSELPMPEAPDYIKTVGDVRKALGDLPDDFPVEFFVDEAALNRQHRGWNPLVEARVDTHGDDVDLEPNEPRTRLLFDVG